MSVEIPRPIDPSLRPLATGNYRIATPAIEVLHELVMKCLRYPIMGALIYGPPRIGKTRAIEYAVAAGPRPAEIDELPRAVRTQTLSRGGAVRREPAGSGRRPRANAGINSAKRMRLTLRIREAAEREGSGTLLLFCDEAQRYNDNEYEWLRDVHDALDRQQIKLFTFLVGQREILSQKTALQIAARSRSSRV
ncbi:AAA family ATPase [Paraburkholderia sp. BR10923]|uniref:AAA family ATPase n=1 Tax=Paraburkholderia sp. BR10923 TaxID=3236992 RepID=UPI0034CFAD90